MAAAEGASGGAERGRPESQGGPAMQGLAGLITMSAFVLSALGDSQGERNDPA